MNDRMDSIVRRGSTPHAADDVSVFEYFEARIAAVDERLQQAIKTNTLAMSLQFDAQQKADLKAVTATEKRFDGVNEFRAQLNDQTRTFATREAVESVSKEASMAHDRLNALIADLGSRLANLEGRLITYVGVVGALATILSAAFAAVGHFLK